MARQQTIHNYWRVAGRWGVARDEDWVGRLNALLTVRRGYAGYSMDDNRPGFPASRLPR
jgi:hypothetical protein